MHKFIENARTENRSLLETEAKELLLEHGLPVPVFKLIENEDEVEEIGELIGYPLVMKIVPPDIIHKSDAGGVKMGIEDGQSARKDYRDNISSAQEYDDKARIYGIIAYRVCPVSIEVIIGMTKDPNFGPVIMFGLGGIFAEVFKYVSFRILPITEIDAKETKR